MNVTQRKTYKLTIITITRSTLNEPPPIDDKVAGILEHICMDSIMYDLKLLKIVTHEMIDAEKDCRVVAYVQTVLQPNPSKVSLIYRTVN